MSMYNLIHGVNPSCLLVFPMLERKQEDWPRFRDCFISDDRNHIDVLCRVGGPVRYCGYGEEVLYEDENFVETFDLEEDPTYAIYRFNVPKKWKDDFDKIIAIKPDEVSDEYVEHLRNFFPLLNEKGVIDDVFRGEGHWFEKYRKEE